MVVPKFVGCLRMFKESAVPAVQPWRDGRSWCQLDESAAEVQTLQRKMMVTVKQSSFKQVLSCSCSVLMKVIELT